MLCFLSVVYVVSDVMNKVRHKIGLMRGNKYVRMFLIKRLFDKKLLVLNIGLILRIGVKV